jgi:glutamate 5-kinase
MSTRLDIKNAKRLVIKIGSSSLGSITGGLNVERINRVVAAIAEIRKSNTQVVLVSSGAVAAGLSPLKLNSRPTDLTTQQAAASVGQSLLIAEYAKAAKEHDIVVGQILLTQDDITRRNNYRNAKSTFDVLLSMGVLPIVNENDSVATSELRYGDNDRIAALVTHLVGADALVLLSDVIGLFDGPPEFNTSKQIFEITGSADLAEVQVGGTGKSGVGSGGMASKIEAAAIAAAAGAPTLLAHVDMVQDALSGAEIGTLFHATKSTTNARSLWLAHASVARGSLQIDAGAANALTTRGASLLAAGVISVQGIFLEGDPLDLVIDSGEVVARGLSSFDSDDLSQMVGKSSDELAKSLGPDFARPVVHRDDLVLLGANSNTLDS